MLIDLWNKTVSPKDKIWHLGDVAFNTRLPVLDRLNGYKELLLMGNHEHKPAAEYLKYFKDVKATFEIGRTFLSHYPVHAGQLESRYNCNVHGHTHRHTVKIEAMADTGIGPMPDMVDDPRYLCVSIEQTGLKPINIDEVTKILRDRGLEP